MKAIWNSQVIAERSCRKTGYPKLHGVLIRSGSKQIEPVTPTDRDSGVH